MRFNHVVGNYWLTYDFYEAFLGWNLRISGLKQLATNSLMFSALSDEEKERSMEVLIFSELTSRFGKTSGIIG